MQGYAQLVFTKSVDSDSRVLIGSRNSDYPWIFAVLGRDSKWLLVSKDEILAVNEPAVPTNTKKKKRQNLACRRLLVYRKKMFLLNMQQNKKKNDPRRHCQLQRIQTLSDVFYLQKVPFSFLSN